MAIDHSPPGTLGGASARDAAPRQRRPGLRRPAAAVFREPTAPALSSLSIECEEHEDLVLVALDGELDTYTTPGFRERLRRLDPAAVQLVIDLRAVSLLDSAGLGELMSLRNEADRGGGQLGLVCPGHRLTRLFRITGLRSAFAFGHDLATVRAALDAARPGRVVLR
jgi:anti-sigma B factor antagonist